MKIINKRVYHTNETTLGIMSIDSKPYAFVIEDEPREFKVKGETRIPAGKYKLALRKVESPLTLKYRKLFPWFTWHIQLMDVPDFKYVYVHIGNDEGDSDACQVIGFNAHIKKADFRNSQSREAYKEFYEKVTPLLQQGIEVTYIILDEFD